MSSKTTVLITGTKTGIGRGLLEAYASRPNTLAIAAIRDSPDSSAAAALTSIPTAQGSKIIVAQYDAGVKSSAVDLVAYLTATHNIKSLDIVIANAGILKHYGPAKEAAPELIEEHFQVNTLAAIILYQATQSLLTASSQTPKFFIISSSIGSNGLQDNYPMEMIAYGMSKAAINWAASRIHREEDRLVVIAMQPGWVGTAMGNKAAAFVGLSPSDVPVSIEDSVSGLVSFFDKADKTTHSGKFWDQEGKQLPW
jgi:norsolorinic acid ketoreductase